MQARIECRLMSRFVDDRIDGKEPVVIFRCTFGLVIGDDPVTFGRVVSQDVVIGFVIVFQEAVEFRSRLKHCLLYTSPSPRD